MKELNLEEIQYVSGARVSRSEAALALVAGANGARVGAAAGAVVGGPVGAAAGAVIGAGLGMIVSIAMSDQD